MSINNKVDEYTRRQYEKYALFTEGKESISLDYLAKAVGKSVAYTQSELQRMVSLGLFGKEAYINYLTKSLVLKSTAPKNTAPRSTNAQRSSTVEPQAAASQKKSTEKKSKVTWQLIVAVILFVAAFGNVLDFVDNLTFGFSYAFQNLGSAIVSAAIGGGLLAYHTTLKKREARYQKYLAVTAGKKSVSLDTLARISGTTNKEVAKDLEKMIANGQFGPKAFVDIGEQILSLDGEIVSQEKQTKQKANAASDGDDQFYGIIKEIRDLNDAIADEDVSDRIYKIEELTSKIFRVVEEKPEKLPQIKSFMSYYLPTTLKLLHSYATLEKQGTGGDNIKTAKKDIERILDRLVQGYTKQLDQLFKSDAIDISSDINVLETMMKKDNLAGESDFGTMGKN